MEGRGIILALYARDKNKSVIPGRLRGYSVTKAEQHILVLYANFQSTHHCIGNLLKPGRAYRAQGNMRKGAQFLLTTHISSQKLESRYLLNHRIKDFLECDSMTFKPIIPFNTNHELTKMSVPSQVSSKTKKLILVCFCYLEQKRDSM